MRIQRLKHPALCSNPWPNTKRTATDKPILIVDGKLHRLRSLTNKVSGHAGYIVGATDRDLLNIGSFVDVEFANFYELRTPDLTPLKCLPRLRHLKIDWNTKITNLDAIGHLEGLETLILVNLPKVMDLSPISRLTELTVLDYSGGVWAANLARSLEPLAALPKLEERSLTNLKVESGGLRPLAKCRALKYLSLSNQFETEDYAYLSVKLPQTQCRSFAPWIETNRIDGTDNVMVTGKRKPFLSRKSDSAKIMAYEEIFRSLQEQFKGRS